VDKEDVDLLNLLGYLYLQYGKSDEARVVYGTLVELAESNPLSILAYAYCLVRCGHYAIALHHLDDVDGGDFQPKARSAYRLLRGNVLWHMGRDEEARYELSLFLAMERKRARLDPANNSLIVKSAAGRARTANAAARGTELAVSVGGGREGIWRRVLRFIAKKELSAKRET
jgi:Flp pilus assembly protein TadD